jgi:hypothetical protein
MRINGRRGSMNVLSSVFPSILVFPSMPKEDIVGQLVSIDVNPWRSLEAIDMWLRLMVSYLSLTEWLMSVDLLGTFDEVYMMP